MLSVCYFCAILEIYVSDFFCFAILRRLTCFKTVCYRRRHLKMKVTNIFIRMQRNQGAEKTAYSK